MDLLEAFAPEDRLEVTFSNFYRFMREAAKTEIMENGIKTRVPHEYIEMMLTGEVIESDDK